MATPSPLSLTPLASSSLPSSQADPAYSALVSTLLDNSSALLDSLKQSTKGSSSPWKKGKTFHATYSNHGKASTATVSAKSAPGTKDGQVKAKWHARESHHKLGWELFRDGLLKDHSLHEQEYIESCVEAKQLATISPELGLWRMSYHLPFPTTNREFVIAILTVDTTPPEQENSTVSPEFPKGKRSFRVVTVPVEHPDAPKRDGWVRGMYASVEEVEEAPEGGVVWRMATASSPGGLVPQWITEIAMPGKIVEDVPSFLEWTESKKAPAAQVDGSAPIIESVSLAAPA